MKSLLILVSLLIIQIVSFAQKKQIEWGELEGKGGYMIEMLPFHEKDFYTVRWKGGNIIGGYYLSRFDNLKETKNKRISTNVNNSIANFEASLIIDDHPVVFLSNIKEGKENIYIQQYGYDLEPRGEIKLIASYELIKGMNKESIKIIQSNDKKYFAVLWLMIGRKKDYDVYGYAIFNDKMTLIDEGEYEVPFDTQFSQVTHHLLSNTGHYFFIVKEFEKNDSKRNNQTDLNYRAMHIFQVSKDEELERYTINVKGKRIEALSINTDDSTNFTITGVYGNNGFSGIHGVFFNQLDFKNKTIIKEGFKEFSKDFITEDWSEREIDKIEKKSAKGKDEPALYHYKIREAQISKDGSIIGIMEQYYVIVKTFSDARSMITYNYVYHYNDIVTFKIGVDGNFDWVEKTKKSQASTNDHGALSSFASIINDDKLFLLFNDNLENYDQNGKYKPNHNYYTRYDAKRNAVAIVEIDLNNGNQNRTVLFTRKETKTIASPKKFKNNNSSNEMLIFTSIKGKEKYGILRFE